jgi:hypothetical protein
MHTNRQVESEMHVPFHEPMLQRTQLLLYLMLGRKMESRYGVIAVSGPQVPRTCRLRPFPPVATPPFLNTAKACVSRDFDIGLLQFLGAMLQCFPDFVMGACHIEAFDLTDRPVVHAEVEDQLRPEQSTDG